jgi:D-alanyl-D-alanine carboxypeptidase
MRFRSLTALTVAALLVLPATDSVAVLKMERIPSVFAELTNSKTLSNPAMVLVDLNTGQTIFSREAKELRKPASTLKLMSAFAALEFLPADKTFSTAIYKTDIENTFQIVGDFDPSITPSLRLAKNLKFVWSDNLVNQIRKKAKSKTLKIRYHGLTYRTKTNMDQYFKRVGYRITWKSITPDETLTHITEQVYNATSPDLTNILNYTLLFSDNWVADYLAKSAAAAAGYGYSPTGISMVFTDVLARYGIDEANVHAFDGSGLSHENRITAQTLVKVLMEMERNPKFASAVNGLPVGGISGTLQNRFIKSAPQAVGLVHAKTGSLNGVVSLAGFVESGERKFAFAIIADRLPIGYYPESAARSAIDKLLGKIAAPLQINPTIEEVPEITPSPSAESAAA